MKSKKEENHRKMKKSKISIAKRNKWIWAFLGYFIGLLGILATIISVVVIRERKEPVYSVSPTSLVAKTVPEEERLKIYWDSTEIQSVSLVKIAIWNKGRRTIDQSDFIKPLRIKPSENVNILATETLRTSRSTLEFIRKIEEDEDSIESVVILVEGNEVLEHGDGGIFHILYSGSEDCEWQLDTRIKGVQEIPKISSEKLEFKPNWSNIIAFIFFIVFIICRFTSAAIRHKRKAYKKINWIACIVGVTFLALFAYMLRKEVLLFFVKPWLSW